MTDELQTPREPEQIEVWPDGSMSVEGRHWRTERKQCRGHIVEMCTRVVIEKSSPGPGPPSPPPHTQEPEWGQSFGSLNLKLRTE